MVCWLLFLYGPTDRHSRDRAAEVFIFSLCEHPYVMVIGYIDGMEMYYRRFCGKGAPLGGYFVTLGGLFRYNNYSYTITTYHSTYLSLSCLTVILIANRYVRPCRINLEATSNGIMAIPACKGVEPY